MQRYEKNCIYANKSAENYNFRDNSLKNMKKRAFLHDFCDKKYIYTTYIYSKCAIFTEIGAESYGNPMGIVWESYGADSTWIVECIENDPE